MSEIARQLGHGITSQRLGQYANGISKPKVDFYDRWKEVFGEDLKELVESGFEKNVSHETQNEKNPAQSEVPESIYRDLVEGNSEYKLVPKTILQEEYRIMLLSEIEYRNTLTNKALESRDRMINVLENRISELTDQINKLQQSQVKAQKV